MEILSIIYAIRLSVTLFTNTNVDENVKDIDPLTQDEKMVDTEKKTVEMDTLTIKGKTYYLVFTEEHLRAIAKGEFG